MKETTRSWNVFFFFFRWFPLEVCFCKKSYFFSFQQKNQLTFFSHSKCFTPWDILSENLFKFWTCRLVETALPTLWFPPIPEFFSEKIVSFKDSRDCRQNQALNVIIPSQKKNGFKIFLWFFRSKFDKELLCGIYMCSFFLLVFSALLGTKPKYQKVYIYTLWWSKRGRTNRRMSLADAK